MDDLQGSHLLAMTMNASRYFLTMDWWTAGIAFIFAMVLYFFTLAPTVTLEYSGALVVAADHLGVARPPGYPIWTLLAKGLICLFPNATYHGYPNPAWAVNFMSAVFGAFACGLLALLTCRLSREMVQRQNSRMCAMAGLVAALLFTFSPVMWSQSVIAETHTLTVFYFLLLLALSLRWMTTRDHRSPLILAFLAGLGLSISPILFLFLPVLLVAAAFVSWKDFIAMSVAALLFCAFLLAESIWGPAREGFDNGVLAAAILAITLALILLLGLFRPTRPISILLFLFLVGLIPTIYLPLAAARSPPMNMGNADTWTGFWHVIHRGQYERIVPANPFAEPLAFVRHLVWYLRLAASQFSVPLAVLALVPALGLPWLSGKARSSIFLVFVALFFFSVVVLIGGNFRLDVQTTWIARVLFIPSFALLALLVGLGLAMIAQLVLKGGRSANPD